MPATFAGRVVVDPVALAALLRGPRGPIYRRLVEDGAAVRLVARRNVGVSKLDPVPRKVLRRPGTLRDSIVSRVVQFPSGIGCAVGSYTVPYALMHHEGTPPHDITPKGNGFLIFHWPKAGGVVYLKRVRHPGTKPNRYLADALRDTLGVRYGRAGYR